MKSVLFFSILLISFHSVAQNKTGQNARLDTNKIAIISFDDFGPFISLNDEELISIEQLLQNCINKHNSVFDSSSYKFIRLDNYVRQYFAYFKGGDKMVWINCIERNAIKKHSYWKKEPVIIFDSGGIFQLSINLSKEQCPDFQISNGGFSKF